MNRSTPPPIQPFVTFPLTEPAQYTLPNGVSCYQFFDPNLELIHINVKLKGGALYETEKFMSQAAFHLLKESSPQYPAAKLDEYLDFCGASWNCTVNLESVLIQWVIPKHIIKELLPVLVETICQPMYTEESLQLFKDQKIKDLEYNTLRTSYRANQLMYRALFDTNPINELLTISHIKNSALQDIARYHEQSVTAENTRIFAAGAIDDSLQQFINNTFLAIPNKTSPLSLHTLSHRKPEVWYEEREDALQSTILLCKKSISYHDTQRREFSFLSTLFGGYFGSRLMKKIREEKGYTYGIQNYSTYFGNESIFLIKSDVNVEATQATIHECFNEMERLINRGITPEELDTVKNYMQGTFLRQVDGVTSLMNTYALWNNFEKDTSEGTAYISHIQNITEETVLNLAKTHLQPAQFHTIIVGKNI